MDKNVEINIELNEEDGPVDTIGLASMMIEQLKQQGNPTLEDWENLKVTFANSAVILNQLVDQEIEKLRTS